MRPEVWLHEGQLIIKHRHGGCYDLLEFDDVGVGFVGEISMVPEGAVRLVPAQPLRIGDQVWDGRRWVTAGGPDEAP